MRFLKSLKNSMNGIFKCVLSEPHMRFHIVAAAYVFVFAAFFRVSRGELAAVVCAVCSVIVAEAFNTAIEYLCDYSCREHNPTIGIVKDIASGAVLLAAVFSVVTGIIVFGDIGKIFNVLEYVFTTWYWALLFAVSLPVSIYFVASIKNIRPHSHSRSDERKSNDKK